MDLELVAGVQLDKLLYRLAARLLILARNQRALIPNSKRIPLQIANRVINNWHDNVKGHSAVNYLADVREPCRVKVRVDSCCEDVLHFERHQGSPHVPCRQDWHYCIHNEREEEDRQDDKPRLLWHGSQPGVLFWEVKEQVLQSRRDNDKDYWVPLHEVEGSAIDLKLVFVADRLLQDLYIAVYIMLNKTVNCSCWVSFKIDYLVLAETDVVAFAWDIFIDVRLKVGIFDVFLGQVLHERFLFHIVVSWKNEGAINVWRLLDEPNQGNHVVTRCVQQKEQAENHDHQ